MVQVFNQVRDTDLPTTVAALAAQIDANAAGLGIASADGATTPGTIVITGLSDALTATPFTVSGFTFNDDTTTANALTATITTTQVPTAGSAFVPASADYVAGSTTANGTNGSWTIGSGTGTDASDADWDASVLYKATVTVDFAGFTSTVLVDTTAANNFVATQADINAAIIKAIADTTGTNNGSELSRLLTTEFGKGSANNQQLIIKSTVQGVNDLTISVNQPNAVTAAAGANAGQVVVNTADYAALEAGLIETGVISSAAIPNNNETEVNAALNLIDGNRNETGAVAVATDLVLDSVNGTDGTNNTNADSRAIIDMGTGANDLVALDSDKDSMDTLVFSDDFGKVSVVNFDGTSTQTPAIPAVSEVQTITFGAAGDIATQGEVSITILGTTIKTSGPNSITNGDTAAQVATKVAAAINAALPAGLNSAIVNSNNDLVLTYANTLGDIANATVTSILTDTTASVATTTAHVNGTNSAPATKEIVVLQSAGASTDTQTVVIDGVTIVLDDTDGNGVVSEVEFATQVAATTFTNYNVVNSNATLGLVMLEAKVAGALTAAETGTSDAAIAANGKANDGTLYTTASGTAVTPFAAGTSEVQTITIDNGADQKGTVTMGIDVDSDGTIQADELFELNVTAGDEGHVAADLVAAINANPGITGVTATQGAAGGTIDDVILTWDAHVDGTAILNPAATTYTDGALRSVSVVETNAGVLFQAAISETLNGDILDFTAFLTNELTSSGSTASAVDKATTLNYINAAGTFEVTGNDVLVMNDFVSNGTETFANLTAEALLNSIKNDTLTTNDHGNLSDATLNNAADTATLLGTTIKSILMVESDINDGEYKVFELTASETSNEFTAATLLGTVDFGETQTTLTDNNIA